MRKKVLEQTAIYFGKVSMPKGYEIDHESLLINIAGSNVYEVDCPIFQPWVDLNTYLIERIYLNFKLNLSNVKTWGDMLYPGKKFEVGKVSETPKNNFVLIYGIKNKLNSTYIKIYHNNIPQIHEIKEGEFVMFPSNLMYTICENKSDKINFIQTILYERF
mgnify:CR=1 FL=1